MIRIVTILALSLLLHFPSLGQNATELVQSAYKLQVAKKHEEAKEIINEAIEAKGGETNKLAWHVRGFIYKDLFIENRNTEEASVYRSEAVQSFLNSIKYDKEEELLQQNEKALRFLAVSHNNEASDIIDEHDPDKLSEAETNYDKYREIVVTLNPDTSLKDKDIEYLLAMSTAHRKVYESDREKYDNHWKTSNDYLNKVLDLDPNSFKALYSQGVAYYNRGAYNLERLPYVDIHDLMEIQSESMRSIEIALPFMIKAYEVDSSKIQAVRALRIINFNLNKIEESKQYEIREKELEEMDPKK